MHYGLDDIEAQVMRLVGMLRRKGYYWAHRDPARALSAFDKSAQLMVFLQAMGDFRQRPYPLRFVGVFTEAAHRWRFARAVRRAGLRLGPCGLDVEDFIIRGDA